MKKIIIIGATASGTVIAANLARQGKETIEHVVYEKRPYVSLGGCGIPFFVGGHATDDAKESLVIRSVDKHIENGVNLKVNHEVISVDLNAKNIVIKNLETNEEFIDTYDELFIGTGATTDMPNWDMGKASNILTSTSLEDADAIRGFVKDKKIKNIVIIGAGSIGIELTESFLDNDKNITLIDIANQPMLHGFDEDMASMLGRKLSETVNWRPLEEVQVFNIEDDKVQSVQTDRDTYDADLVIIATGFKPNTSLFEGVDKLDNGAIIVNEFGQTSVDGVWSAGDCATVKHRVSGKNVWIPLATTAGKLSNVVANKLLGKEAKFLGTLGTAGLRFGDVEMFRTGLTETEAKELKIDIKTTTIESVDSARYAGVGKPIALKVVAKVDGTIIGAQAYGSNKSPSTRIATLAMAIWNEMNIKELSQFDLFYSPAFSRASDVIHLAARKLLK